MASPADHADHAGAPSRPAGRALLRVRAWGARPLVALAEARGHLFPFAPVMLGIGIGVYVLLPVEPSGSVLALAGLAAALGVALARRGPEAAQPLAWALALVFAGLVLAGLRAQQVAAPVLDSPRHGPIEGRIVAVDRSASGAVRLTLDQVVLNGLDPARTPARVRISVPDAALAVDPVAGRRVMLTGFLGPPAGPVEPGGFDFRRLAWFERLGAVGHTRTPVLALGDPEPGWALRITRWRQDISAGIRARLPGDVGGFVAAILTGDRSAVDADTQEDLRRTNLAHLLAISGLHMGLLTGAVYGALRAVLALWPWAALRWPVRKLAATGALAAAACYLLLSGGNVATQRAFVMAAVMLAAVLVDRRAISLRSVAMAALAVLVLRPESLLSVGFHMSFAATVALVAVFRALRDHRRTRPGPRPRWRRLAAPLAGAALCSLVAGLATAPFAAAAFHRYAEYGLLANLLSVPLMGALVMPAAVLAAALWPIGLEGVGLWLMGLGTRWILGVAQTVSGFEGAVTMIAAPAAWVLPTIALGGLWLALWPGRARWAGLPVLAFALAGWALSPRPVLLVDREGDLVGLLGPEGRALSRARGAGYAATSWLEADGDPAAQAEAARRPGLTPVAGGVRFELDGQVWLHLHGRAGRAALPEACVAGVVIVTDADWRGRAPGPCRLLDPRALRQTGALALDARGRAVSVAERAGARPWSRGRGS